MTEILYQWRILMRHTWIFAFVGLCMCLARTAGQDPSAEDASKNLTDQANAMTMAFKSQNYTELAKWTHPTLVKQIGGKEKFVELVSQFMNEMKVKGITSFSIDTGVAGKQLEQNGVFYAVIPTKGIMKHKDGTEISLEGYLLATSTDKGRMWTFIDGNGIRDSEALKIILPDAPKELELPKRKQPVIKKPE